jgi:hypothetical protein
MTFPSPDPVFVLADAVLSCLTDAVTGIPGAPANICFRVGTEIAHDIDVINDLCCEGLAYVALGDTFPSSDSFPEQDIIRQSNTVCAPPAWAQAFRIGIIRCVPVVMDDTGAMPTCADWNTAATQNMWDSVALRRAACCIRNYFANAANSFFLGMSIVIERQVQGSALGGCVERYMTITLQFPNCDCL